MSERWFFCALGHLAERTGRSSFEDTRLISSSRTSQSGRMMETFPPKNSWTGIIVENSPWKRRFIRVVRAMSSR